MKIYNLEFFADYKPIEPVSNRQVRASNLPTAFYRAAKLLKASLKPRRHFNTYGVRLHYIGEAPKV